MSQTLTNHRVQLHKALGMQEQICCNGGMSGNPTDGHQLLPTRPGSTTMEDGTVCFCLPAPRPAPRRVRPVHVPELRGAGSSLPAPIPPWLLCLCAQGKGSHPRAEDFALWTLIALWYEAQISNTKQGPPS